MSCALVALSIRDLSDLLERRKWGGLIELYCIPSRTDVDRAYVPISLLAK